MYALGRAAALGGSEHRAFELMRLFGVAMLLVSACLAILLVRDVVGPSDAMPVSAIVLVVFLLPATVIRFVTVANAVLEVPLALVVAILLWRAWTRDSPRLLVAASAVYGLCLVTKLTMAPLVAPLLVTTLVLLWRRRDSWRRVLGIGALVVVVPLVLVTPWLLSNHSRYDAWTANDLAKRIQAPVINPTNRAYPYSEIVDRAGVQLERLAVPQEWDAGGVDWGAAPQLRWILVLALAGVPLVVALVRGCGWRRSTPDRVDDPRALVVLLAPFPLAVLFLGSEMHSERWNVMLGRYMLYALPLLVVFGALQWRATIRSRPLLVACGGALAVVALALWAVLVPHLPADAEAAAVADVAATAPRATVVGHLTARGQAEGREGQGLPSSTPANADHRVTT